MYICALDCALADLAASEGLEGTAVAIAWLGEVSLPLLHGLYFERTETALADLAAAQGPEGTAVATA